MIHDTLSSRTFSKEPLILGVVRIACERDLLKGAIVLVSVDRMIYDLPEYPFRRPPNPRTKASMWAKCYINVQDTGFNETSRSH